jgi:hypothetical protein
MTQETGYFRESSEQNYPLVWRKIINEVFDNKIKIEEGWNKNILIIKYAVNDPKNKISLIAQEDYFKDHFKGTKSIYAYYATVQIERLMVCGLDHERLQECPQMLLVHWKSQSKNSIVENTLMAKVNMVNNRFIDDFKINNPLMVSALMSKVLTKMDLVEENVYSTINRGRMKEYDAYDFYLKNFPNF